MHRILKRFGNFVGLGNIQRGVNEDMQIEKDFPARSSCSQFVPVANPALRCNDILNLSDGVGIDGAFGEFVQTAAKNLRADEYNHQADHDRGNMVAMVKAELHRDKTNRNRNGT